MEHLPEEVDVPGLADHVDHLVEGDRGVVENRVGLGVAEEEVDGSPRHGEGVADLEEELVGELEAACSEEVRVEARLGRVLLLVEDGADSEEVVRVYWGGGGLGRGGGGGGDEPRLGGVESQGNEAVADQGLGECGSLSD